MNRFCFILFFTNILNAQVNGVVLDSVSKEPIVYANVILKSEQIGVATNFKGAFLINNKNSLNSDTLMASYVGYKTQKKVINHTKKDSIYTFFLKEDLQLLNEVLIKSSKKLSKGTYKIKSKGKKLIGHNIKYNEEVIKLVNNDKNTSGKLLNVTFYFRNYESDYGQKLPVHYRLNFYYVDSISKKPKDLVLLESDIIIKPEDKNKKHPFEVDLKNYNIKFPKEGLYIGLQSINPSLTQPKAGAFYVITPMLLESYVKKASTYYRTLGGETFANMKGIKKNYYRDLIIDVELKYYEN
ncbi:CarboxypepD_reg-like domain-containing protein [Bizionia echini]|uniref:CarboxypepD_reg-like domain-containing protein n=1 Tax=Bizionia echini TaxID=649333 RepID=A0A1I5DVC9_9FLAO|nr:carboxypeptidase-like regulatory domain-containing protein [Bizionia echini]SFO03224.1 CarboxypepD_reg-like domain-containing protein [Bizionia echini]